MNDFPNIHNDDIGPEIGKFKGLPVRAWYPEETEKRERAEARKRIQSSGGRNDG